MGRPGARSRTPGRAAIDRLTKLTALRLMGAYIPGASEVDHVEATRRRGGAERRRPERRHWRGTAPAPLSPPGHDPRIRAARLRPVPAEPRQGYEPPLARPGGGRGRIRRRHA